MSRFLLVSLFLLVSTISTSAQFARFDLSLHQDKGPHELVSAYMSWHRDELATIAARATPL